MNELRFPRKNVNSGRLLDSHTSASDLFETDELDWQGQLDFWHHYNNHRAQQADDWSEGSMGSFAFSKRAISVSKNQQMGPERSSPPPPLKDLGVKEELVLNLLLVWFYCMSERAGLSPLLCINHADIYQRLQHDRTLRGTELGGGGGSAKLQMKL